MVVVAVDGEVVVTFLSIEAGAGAAASSAIAELSAAS